MLLSVKFIHTKFLLKKSKYKVSSVWFVYSLLVKKITLFYMLQWQIYSVPKLIHPKLVYTLKFRIPDKTILNLVFLELFNLVNGVELVDSIKFFSCRIKKTKYTVLRSSFIHKVSREQLLLEYYSGRFKSSFVLKNFLIADFIRFYFFGLLKFLTGFNIKKKKNLTIV